MATRSTIFYLAWWQEVLSSSRHGNQQYYLLLAWQQEVLSSTWHGDKKYYLPVGMVTRSIIFPWECLQLAWWSGASSSLQKALGWHGAQKEERRDRLVPPFRLSTCTPVLKVPTRILQGKKINKLIKIYFRNNFIGQQKIIWKFSALHFFLSFFKWLTEW